jgi:hypothetical protein
MSTEEDKFKHSKRLLKDENAIKKQVKIAKQHRVSEYNPGEPKQPHRFNKHHAMDCGNPECFMCGNPRKTHKDKLTAQEKRLFQDVEKTTDKHSNGLPIEEDDERED